MIELAEQYGRYGYRRVTEMLRRRGWRVNHKPVARLLRPADRDHAWSYDFVHDRTHDGRAFRILTLIDEYTS